MVFYQLTNYFLLTGWKTEDRRNLKSNLKKYFQWLKINFWQDFGFPNFVKREIVYEVHSFQVRLYSNTFVDTFMH